MFVTEGEKNRMKNAAALTFKISREREREVDRTNKIDKKDRQIVDCKISNSNDKHEKGTKFDIAIGFLLLTLLFLRNTRSFKNKRIIKRTFICSFLN